MLEKTHLAGFVIADLPEDAQIDSMGGVKVGSKPLPLKKNYLCQRLSTVLDKLIVHQNTCDLNIAKIDHLNERKKARKQKNFNNERKRVRKEYESYLDMLSKLRDSLEKTTVGDQRSDILIDIERVMKKKNEAFSKLENLDENECVRD